MELKLPTRVITGVKKANRGKALRTVPGIHYTPDNITFYSQHYNLGHARLWWQIWSLFQFIIISYIVRFISYIFIFAIYPTFLSISLSLLTFDWNDLVWFIFVHPYNFLEVIYSIYKIYVIHTLGLLKFTEHIWFDEF